MTEKVVLTKEQAKAIEEFQKTVHELGISLDELKGIFESGYEVKPEFKVGDFIEIELFGRGVVVEITGINNADGRIRINGSSEFNEYNVIRKLTDEEIQQEKERRWWKKHGREPWELREGDCLISKHDKHSCNVKFVEDCDDEGFLLVDGIKDEYILTVEELANKYQIFCFAEDRKDVRNKANLHNRKPIGCENK